MVLNCDWCENHYYSLWLSLPFIPKLLILWLYKSKHLQNRVILFMLPIWARNIFAAMILSSIGIWLHSRVVITGLGCRQQILIQPWQYSLEAIKWPEIRILTVMYPDQGRRGNGNSHGKVGIGLHHPDAAVQMNPSGREKKGWCVQVPLYYSCWERLYHECHKWGVYVRTSISTALDRC